MSKIIDSAGKGSAITAVEHDANLSSFCGINEPQTGATHTIDVDDQNKIIEYSRGTAIAVTLPAISTVSGANIHTDDFKVTLKNIGAGAVTATCGGADTIDNGDTTIVLAQYDSVTIQTDNSLTKWNVIERIIVDLATKTGSETLTNKTISGGAIKDIIGVVTGNAGGNLQIDAPAGYGTYINYDTGSGTVFGDGAGGVSGASVSSAGVMTASGGFVGDLTGNTGSNLLIDAVAGQGTYINYQTGSGTVFGNGAGGVSGAAVDSSGNITGTSFTGTLQTGDVGTATAGLALNAVGSYAFCKNNTGGAVNAGNTVVITGTELIYSNVDGASGGSPTGTWRCMGYASNTSATLWLKIA